MELCDCFLDYGEASAEMFLLLTFVAFGAGLIWTGLAQATGRTLLFAGVALVARTRGHDPGPPAGPVGWERLPDHRLVRPQGLSSLLLVLLPVFAGVPGSDRLFAITCLVVLLSVVVHGEGSRGFWGG